MAEHGNDTVANGRRAPRVGFEGQVVLRFPAGAVRGPGRNIAEQGVLFTTRDVLPVTVEVEGHDVPLTGQLVRIESMGNGEYGIAVKFDAPHPALVGG